MTARLAAGCLCLAFFACGPGVWAQTPPPRPDPLGRDTPRGTVLGFITAARDGKYDIASQYLNPGSRGESRDLANKLYVVLNGRLPARLSVLSDEPEGSLANPLTPDRDVVGTIPTSRGELPLVLERVLVRNGGRVWLFAGTTLQAIPDVYREVHLLSVDRYLPRFLTFRIAGIRLFEWLVLVILLPALYRLLGVADWLIPLAWARWVRRGRVERAAPFRVPRALRLLALAIAIHAFVPTVDLPLVERQLWASVSALLAIAGGVGLLLVLVAGGERYVERRVRAGNLAERRALLRLMRRVGEVLVVSAGVVAILHFVGIDPTAALAGLGIGGIAVALAAQKTLENVIGGFSLVFDKAVRVGDVLKLGEMAGTVDHIGLRSTRIRTLDRTIVSVPNGHIAGASIETLSLRDKFWFHHVVGLRYETTAAQMRGVSTGMTTLLAGQPGIERESVRVRFFRLGPSSLDIEVSAYVFAADWERFLAIQQELLLCVMEIVEREGTGIAFPSHTVHLANDQRAQATSLAVARR